MRIRAEKSICSSHHPSQRWPPSAANRVVRTSDRINKGLVCTIAEGKTAHLELIQIPRTKAERGTERAFAESRSWRSTAIDTDLAGDFSGQRSKVTRKVMVKIRFMVKIFTLFL